MVLLIIMIIAVFLMYVVGNNLITSKDFVTCVRQLNTIFVFI